MKEKDKDKVNRKDELLRKGSKTVDEFKKFISRGNVVDMAVGTIIGAAFGKIVSSIVNDILMPIIGLLIGGIDFSSLSIKFKGATIAYGMFIQNVIDFLIIAVCVFMFIKFISAFTRKHEEKLKEPPAPIIDEKLELLKEIRDLMKKQK